MRILLNYKTERYREGKRESVVRRGDVIEAGETFAAWHTAAEGGGVRFTVAHNPFVALIAEDFLLKPNEEHPFTCTERYRDDRDTLHFDDVTEGTAKIVS